ncbi:hypothetical protein BDZ45DRAFT_777709 [Acephala macrosclerotiorum]|nr:hypothetical protein BDZ45DRAFT_777709 [Acephala macrosclerotiorum]
MNAEGDGQVGGSSALGPREAVFDPKEAIIFPETHCNSTSRETPCDCRDEKKNSSFKWSTMADTVVAPFFKSSEPKSFDDPAWPPESQSHVLELGGEWGWPPESHSFLTVVKGTWEFCDFKKPPYNQLDDPIILNPLKLLSPWSTTDPRTPSFIFQLCSSISQF